MRASFIYPVHNRARYMETTLSGLSQFNVDWRTAEIVVVDDASTDNLVVVIEKYEKLLPINYVYVDSSLHPKAAGRKHPFIVVYAMNEGIRRASGDDVILSCPEVSPLNVNRPDAMQCFINYPLKEKQVVFGTVLDQSPNNKLMKWVSPAQFWPYFFFGKMRRRDWWNVGGYDEDFLPYVSCADVEFDDRLSRAGFTYMFLNEPVMVHCYHKRTNFSMGDEFEKAEEFCKSKINQRKSS